MTIPIKRRRRSLFKKTKDTMHSAIDALNGLSIWTKLYIILYSIVWTPIYILISLLSISCIWFGYFLYKNGFTWNGKLF